MLFLLVHFMLSYAAGATKFETSELYLEGDTPFESTTAKALNQIFKIIYLLGVAGRLLLLVISLKKLNIVRTYIYYEFVMLTIDQCAPMDVSLQVQTHINILYISIMFSALSFDFKKTLSATILS